MTLPVSQAYVEADGVRVFYRYAGDESKPAILLLHGFPSSSHMYRNLIPLLAESYRVIAPDFPGYGFTEVSEERKYEYTFANLTQTTEAFIDLIGLTRFSLYIFDYGAPTGLRLALRRPQAITAIITQSGNAYEEGLGSFWDPIKKYWASGSAEDRDALRFLVTLDATKWQYTTGSPNPGLIQPEAWTMDQAGMDRPGNGEIQLDLLYSYGTNIPLYPQFQEYFSASGVPILAAWGKNDPIFIYPGAEAYARHAKKFELHLLDAGHFALERNEKTFADLIDAFLKKNLA
jgi:pimeloyl-ACP methyl ester carboxylesterase